MKYLTALLPLIFLYSCEPPNPNLNTEGEDVLEAKEVFSKDTYLPFRDTVYVPIYSDIYTKTIRDRYLLTATLSIRNTSLTDSLFVEDIDYYDTEGALVRSYLKEKNLLLRPMQSIEYVIEENDATGGAGANFLINWGAKDDRIKPIFQGVMTSTRGQHGFAFTTDGVSVSRR